MHHPRNTHPFHTNPPSLQKGVEAPTRTSDAFGSEHPSFTEDLRSALEDLANANHTSILRITDPKCPMGVCLERHDLARFSTHKGPGRWVITQKGWLYLERRTTTSEETR